MSSRSQEFALQHRIDPTFKETATGLFSGRNIGQIAGKDFKHSHNAALAAHAHTIDDSTRKIPLDCRCEKEFARSREL